MTQTQNPGFEDMMPAVENIVGSALYEIEQFKAAFKIGVMSMRNPKDVFEFQKAQCRIHNLKAIAMHSICLN